VKVIQIIHIDERFIAIKSDLGIPSIPSLFTCKYRKLATAMRNRRGQNCFQVHELSSCREFKGAPVRCDAVSPHRPSQDPQVGIVVYRISGLWRNVWTDTLTTSIFFNLRGETILVVPATALLEPFDATRESLFPI